MAEERCTYDNDHPAKIMAELVWAFPCFNCIECRSTGLRKEDINGVVELILVCLN